MTVTPERVAAVVHELQGTCKSLHEVLTEDEEHDQAMLNGIDDEISLCDGCHWWCENAEMDDDNLCEDCKEERDDD